MKKKSTVICFCIFIIVLVLFFSIYSLFDNDYKYSCTDYETNTTYKFNNKETMKRVCNNYVSKEDTILKSDPIYSKLLSVDDRYGFSFDPYVNTNNKIAIIIRILDCRNQNDAIRRSKKWFVDNEFNMNNYVIEYEFPCGG